VSLRVSVCLCALQSSTVCISHSPPKLLSLPSPNLSLSPTHQPPTKLHKFPKPVDWKRSTTQNMQYMASLSPPAGIYCDPPCLFWFVSRLGRFCTASGKWIILGMYFVASSFSICPFVLLDPCLIHPLVPWSDPRRSAKPALKHAGAL